LAKWQKVVFVVKPLSPLPSSFEVGLWTAFLYHCDFGKGKLLNYGQGGLQVILQHAKTKKHIEASKVQENFSEVDVVFTDIVSLETGIPPIKMSISCLRDELRKTLISVKGAVKKEVDELIVIQDGFHNDTQTKQKTLLAQKYLNYK
jgi:hypothetical protein